MSDQTTRTAERSSEILPARRLRLGDVEVDVAAGEVHREEGAFSLEPQPTKVLELLASRPGEVVRREELKRHLWGDERHVEADQGLNYCISELRRALGDSARDPRFIETLPRRGYRLVTPVEPIQPSEPTQSARPSDPPDPMEASGAVGWTASAGPKEGPLPREPGEAAEGNRPPRSSPSGELSGRAGAGERRRVVVLLILVTAALLVAAAALVELPFAGDPEESAAPEEGPPREPRPADQAPSVADADDEVVAAEAHRLVSRAQFLSAQEDLTQKEKALELAGEAVRLDPDSAEAHLVLGQVLLDLPRPPRATAPRARAAVERALALDPELAEAHVALGRIELFYHRRLERAGASFRRALELEPGLADGHYNRALLLAAQDRDPEAVAAMRRARELDPLSAVIHADLGFIHYFGGRYARAIVTAREVLGLDPENRLAPQLGLLSAIQLQDEDQALEFGRLLAVLTGGPRRPIESLADYWRWQLAWYEFERESGRYRNPVIAARAHLELGRPDEAVRALGAACQERAGWFMPFLSVDPGWQPLADHPRFPALLACSRGASPDAADVAGDS